MEIKYKDFSNSKIIGIDLETYDPDLTELGPGDLRPDTYVLGFSLADETGFAEYYNLGHYDCYPDEKEKNLKYLKEVMAIKNVPKLGVNIGYDIGYIENKLGIPVKGQLYDIQIAEALLDENKMHLDLDSLAKDYLGKGKTKEKCVKFCEENNLKGDFRKWLFKMPYPMVREYGIDDAADPVQIFRVQWQQLHNQDLLDLLHLECDLLKPLTVMRRTGVKIDTKKRDKNALFAHNTASEIKLRLFEKYGEFNFNSTQQLANIFTKEGIPILKTSKGNPSVTKSLLKSLQDDYELAADILNVRKASKTLNDFLFGSLKKFPDKDNLIHCSFYNTKIETGEGGMRGTRSGRFSSVKPNLQQIPSISTDKLWGTICREIFIPFENCWWGKIDYAQIEYRFMAHFAIGPGSEELRNAYLDNPLVDYHQYIIDLTGLTRKFAKNLNFGVAYGMGAKKMASLYGWTLEHCYEILATYHQAAPYIKATIKEVEQAAKRKGFIQTFLNRRSRLIDFNKVYVMFCRLIQGSAADLMKKAMIDIWNAGIFDELAFHLTVHDELDMSIPKTKNGIEAFQETKNIMENCVKLKVPIIADAEIGSSWANLEDFNLEKFRSKI